MTDADTPNELGLRRGALALHAYSESWPALFAAERSVLLAHLSPWVVDVEHVGSTAIPGLEAKPLIDMQAGIRDLAEVRVVVPVLTGLGYHYMSDRVYDTYVFLPKGPESRRTHHLNLVQHDSDEWRTRLRFRDALRADPALAARYLDLKRSLAARHLGDRASYTAAKASFIQAVLRDHP
ncbi:GrpB family protein [Nocardioides okcheonensis]|uniref:GrpB family protein n=1 Tax=Nocardioides okcheonensis TaxID=2894081 RepID=UPI001E312A08|nr:GrpB family protein [Nocardioides okcheonensis]UFN46294.1 GrpB family protein [Nocardioides okcheonensis]